MDYKDLEAGYTPSSFWFKAKKNLVNILINKLNKKNLKILSLGAGTGDDIKVLNKFGEVYVIDINKKALDVIPDHLCKEKKVSDACNLGYKDDFFDLVTSFDVFEHIKDDQKAILEVHRVLKPNGKLIFSVPAFKFLFGPHDRAYDHHRRYSKKEIKGLMKPFDNLRLNYWNSLLFIPISLMRLAKKNSGSKADNQNFPKLIDYLLYKILTIDNFLIRIGLKLPFGLSLIGIARK